MAKLDPKKAKETFEKYLKEINNLEGVPAEGGSEFRETLNEKIRTLINLSFDDSREKLKRYNQNPYMSLTLGMPSDQVEKVAQQYHSDKLNLMKQCVNAYIEELSLIMDTDTKTGELSEIEEKIKKSALESDRREEVAKSKFFGAVIEMLDFQRNELKRRSESDKEISEIKIRLAQIEERLSQNIKNEELPKKLQEDVWYNEILENTKSTILVETVRKKKVAKQIYSQIKVLRSEISGLEHHLGNSTLLSAHRQEINATIITKRREMTELLKSLGNLWSELSR